MEVVDFPPHPGSLFSPLQVLCPSHYRTKFRGSFLNRVWWKSVAFRLSYSLCFHHYKCYALSLQVKASGFFLFYNQFLNFPISVPVSSFVMQFPAFSTGVRSPLTFLLQPAPSFLFIYPSLLVSSLTFQTSAEPVDQPNWPAPFSLFIYAQFLILLIFHCRLHQSRSSQQEISRPA